MEIANESPVGVDSFTYGNRGAAAYLGVSPHTTNQWRVEGFGPEFVKMGSRVIYTRKSLDEFLASRSQRSTSETPKLPPRAERRRLRREHAEAHAAV
jgi:hypothetical protein